MEVVIVEVVVEAEELLLKIIIGAVDVFVSFLSLILVILDTAEVSEEEALISQVEMYVESVIFVDECVVVEVNIWC